ncbi:flavin reductase family protein [Sediminibacillus massiliensis]|uniref:flavin reductase family protein n=1 Tax=Sediminibacillus massiliensis TaxID=1926277 RepID=UPI0009883256|nr:flavin reductase family protein [Sediminibacillus massiliensis]
MRIEKSQFAERNMSKLVKGAVVPRPIAWVSTISKQGERNLAPFSFFTVASMDPITLCFSVGGGDRQKDTLQNIEETKDFVINIVSKPLANQMYETSKNFDAPIDEFTEAGLASAKSRFVHSPLVKDAPIQMECELDRVVEVGTNRLVLGKLVCYHIKEEVYMYGDKVNPEKLEVIGRMAGDYTLINNFFPLPEQ